MFKKSILKIIFLGSIIAGWWVITALQIWPSWLLPSPVMVAQTLAHDIATGKLGWAILISLRRLLIGFAISLGLGGALGFALAKSKMLNEMMGWLITGLQTLPSICWLPLALLWFGLSETAIIFVVVMGALLSITVAVEGAVKTIPPLWLRVGHMLGARGLGMYRSVIVPAMLPALVTGLKQGWSFAWRSLMAGEMLYVTAGLGNLLVQGRDFDDMSQVMAVMLTIIFIGATVDQCIFRTIEHRVYRKWGLT